MDKFRKLFMQFTLKKFGFLAILINLVVQLTNSANAGNLSSTVDRNQISPNETLTLTVTYDEQIDSSQLDLNSLEQDFDVLGISPQTSSSVSIVNGQASRQASTIWTITLIAKRAGTLSIPAFSVQQDRSKPISIQASDGAAVPSSALPLTARVSTDRASIYPSQQLIVEIELSAHSNVSDLNGPQLIIQGADVELLDQQRYQRIDNGVARQVVTLRYAAYAKQQGELVIPIMTYTGIKGGRRSLFGTRGQQVVARTTQLEVSVNPLPANSGAQWFPADNVEITSSWSRDTNDIKVGEPITRTITITAKGQRASLIPPFAKPSIAQSYKTYQDQPQLKNQKTAQGFIGIRTESEAIVASKEGDLELPELKIDWWDVNENKWRTAILPAQTHKVSAGTASQLRSNEEQSADSSSLSSANGTVNNSLGGHNKMWQWLTGALGLLCLLQFGWIVRLRAQDPSTYPITETDTSESTAWVSLQMSLKQGEPMAIRNKLIAWAKTALPNQNHVGLQTIYTYAERFDATNNKNLKSALTELDAHLYQGGNEFSPERIKGELETLRKQMLEANTNATKTSDNLPPLYEN